ncbi:branched-chain amino acid ABC transporter permease [Nonomuraea basaltis]|uniref:branched-chain amino acid ABC transporter permease n=1 Tax=Nonomuraea basaltis TaxID=2495887 RepID=UPI00110C611E|nr:branched-chain amino acid ABC transporter permease [Nonomuraea basaltis]TMR98416.1 branched-chain amino acid ABC transporter permease [Nonomuraea basaltis]
MLQASVAGLLAGGAYAMVGVCVVLLFQMTGVLNVAQAAIGAFGTMVMLQLLERGWGFGVALPAGVLTAAALAALLGWAIARFYADSSAQVRTIVTVAVLVGLLAIGFRLFGNDPRTVPSLVPGAGFRLADVVVSGNALIALVLAAAIAVGAGLLLNRSRLGVRLRAISERPVTAEMLGVPVTALAVGVWAVMGAVTAVAVTAVAPTRPSNFLSLSLLVMPAMAAALLGGLRNLAGAALGGVLIGVIEGAGTSVRQLSEYRQVLPFLVVVVALVWLQRREVWDATR